MHELGRTKNNFPAKSRTMGLTRGVFAFAIREVSPSRFSFYGFCPNQQTETHFPKNQPKMIRSHYLAILILPSACGFGIPKPFSRTTRTALFVGEKPISWPDYKHDYIDPITPHETPSKVLDHTDPVKRAIADEYWLKQFEEDKEKLHHMMEKAKATKAAETYVKPSETWPHYKHENIDPITPHETASKVASHMDPAKRKIADEYWLQWYNDEKDRLHKND